MFGFKELKPKICIAENTVDCPVNDCKEKVDRQRHKFRRDDRFKCPKHGIFISPSTFEYEDYKNNLLWKAREDVELLETIFREKRESRIARDNSEDAVTWNVFRFLEKNNLIEGLLTNITGASQTQGQITYWSYSQQQRVGDCRNLLYYIFLLLYKQVYTVSLICHLFALLHTNNAKGWNSISPLCFSPLLYVHR